MAEERLALCSDLPLEREILHAAAAETAPPEVRRRALASLGLLALAPSAAVALTASTAAATTKGAGAVGKALWYQAWYVKAALVLGLGSASVAAETTYASKSGSEESRELRKLRATTKHREPSLIGSTTPAPLRPESLLDTQVPLALDHDTQRANGASSAASHGRARAPAVIQSVPVIGQDAGALQRASSIRDEIRLLDRARAELAHGYASAAARTIDEYLARYPRGELRIEAAAVKREALRPR